MNTCTFSGIHSSIFAFVNWLLCTINGINWTIRAFVALEWS